MSAQKNTLFNYFGKSPSVKPSSNGSPAPGTPKTSKIKDSPSTTPKRAISNGARAEAQDSPKSTKSVTREQLMAASPRTRVQRKLLDAAASTHEPHFLRHVLSPQNKKSGQYASPQKNKENGKQSIMSPVFKALKEDEESMNRRCPSSSLKSIQFSQSSSEDVVISPAKCSPRKPVRNLNKEFVNSTSKRSGEEPLHGKKVKGSIEDNSASDSSVDVYSLFGQYVASEMKRLNSDRAVRALKLKIMKSILEVQSEQETETR